MVLVFGMDHYQQRWHLLIDNWNNSFFLLNNIYLCGIITLRGLEKISPRTVIKVSGEMGRVSRSSTSARLTCNGIPVSVCPWPKQPPYHPDRTLFVLARRSESMSHKIQQDRQEKREKKLRSSSSCTSIGSATHFHLANSSRSRLVPFVDWFLVGSC